MRQQRSSRFETALLGVLALTISLLSGACTTAAEKTAVQKPAQPSPTAGDDDIIVKLSPSKLKREGKFTVKFDKSGMPVFQRPEDETLVRGQLNTGEETVAFFLPEHGPYKLTTDNDHALENDSTSLSVDANGDQELLQDERWFTSMPVRVGNKMYEVKAIDPGGTWIRFAKSATPLSGMVPGRRCPDFTLVTMDKKTATLNDYKGKVLLLDVWSMT